LCREALASLLLGDAWHRRVLAMARSLELPDWAVGAGFVRNRVWDHLHGYRERSFLPDIDVLYFDPRCLDEDQERLVEAALGRAAPDLPWSVKNQARMHLRNGDRAYRDTEDALGHWLKTPTCVAVRLEADDALTILAPYGLEDLWEMRARPTPSGRRRLGDYRARMADKNWPATWPG